MKRMIRVMALVLALCLLMTGFPVTAFAAENKLDFADLDAKSVRFQKNKTLIREKDFTITTKNIKLLNGGFILLDLEVRNTGKESFYCLGRESVIGGYEVATGMYQTVKPGGKVTEQIYIDVLLLTAAGLDVVRDIHISFDVINSKTYQTMYEDCSITVPLGIPIELDYYPYEQCIYENKNMKLTLLGASSTELRSSPAWVFRMENKQNIPVLIKNEDNKFTVDNKARSLFIYETVNGNSDYLFNLSCDKAFLAGKGNKDITVEFPMGMYDNRDYRPLAETQIRLIMNKDGKIKKVESTQQKTSKDQSAAKQPEQSKDVPQSDNMFLGMYDGYTLNAEYADILHKKYPGDSPLYSDDCFIPYVSELLVLYLDALDKAGYDFEVIERPDLCTELAYVVELTEKGESVIQISFNQVEYDPKAAQIITLGCSMDYEDLDKTNSNLEAMWIAYEMLNVQLTERERAHVIDNSEITTDERYGVMMRGQFHGLGYVQATGEKETYLIISPDLSLPVFKGMK